MRQSLHELYFWWAAPDWAETSGLPNLASKFSLLWVCIPLLLFFFFFCFNCTSDEKMSTWSGLHCPAGLCWLAVLKITGEAKKNVEADLGALLENETQKLGPGRFYLKAIIT
jgi:hypothetical protein